MKIFDIILQLWILIFLNNICSAQAPLKGYEMVLESSQIREKFSAASNSINSFKADMTQEKHLKMLQDKLTSKGLFYYQKENKIRIEYVTPFKYLMVINGAKIAIKDNNNKMTKIDAGNNAIFKQINSLMIDCIKGSFLANKDFSIALFQNKEYYLFQLTPVKKGLKDFFSTIQIFVFKSDYSIQKLVLKENGGDFTIIHFSNKNINLALPASLFNTN